MEEEEKGPIHVLEFQLSQVDFSQESWSLAGLASARVYLCILVPGLASARRRKARPSNALSSRVYLSLGKQEDRYRVLTCYLLLHLSKETQLSLVIQNSKFIKQQPLNTVKIHKLMITLCQESSDAEDDFSAESAAMCTCTGQPAQPKLHPLANTAQTKVQPTKTSPNGQQHQLLASQTVTSVLTTPCKTSVISRQTSPRREMKRDNLLKQKI